MNGGAVLETTRATAGMLGLWAPKVTGRVEVLGGRPLPQAVYRILGGRQVAQAALLLHAGDRAHRVGAVVDGLHAASMVGLAIVSSRHRRAALAQVVIATSMCASEVATAAKAAA